MQICHVEVDGLQVTNKLQFNVSPEATQINVYNSPGMYNLLTSVLHKRKYSGKYLEKSRDDSKESKVYS